MTRGKKPVVPGEVNEYAIEIMATANLFQKGHRICLEITSLDCRNRRRQRDQRRIHPLPHLQQQDGGAQDALSRSRSIPSHLLLPVIPGA